MVHPGFVALLLDIFGAIDAVPLPKLRVDKWIFIDGLRQSLEHPLEVRFLLQFAFKQTFRLINFLCIIFVYERGGQRDAASLLGRLSEQDLLEKQVFFGVWRQGH